MQMLQREQAQGLARSLAIGRIAIGVLALLVPGPMIRLWTGRQNAAGARMLGRVIGGREVALGLGALLALKHQAPVRGWMEAASLSDAVDCAVTATRFRSLPRIGRWLFLVGAAVAAATEGATARSVDA